VSLEILTTLIHFGTSTFESFKHSYTFILRSTPYLELQIEHHAPLVIDDYDLHDFRRLGVSSTPTLFSPKYSILKVPVQAPCVHLNQRLRSTSGLRRLGVSDAHTTFSLGVFSSEVKDLAPRVTLIRLWGSTSSVPLLRIAFSLLSKYVIC
jgi:hypothetical protein